MDVSISNSHLCSFQKTQSHHPKVIKPNQELGGGGTTVKHYTCSCNCLCPYRVKYSPAWHLRTRSRFQSTHRKTNVCKISAGMFHARLFVKGVWGGKVTVKWKLFSVGHLHFVIVINRNWGVLQPACPQIGTIDWLDGCQHTQNQSARIIRVIVLSFTPPHAAMWLGRSNHFWSFC